MCGIFGWIKPTGKTTTDLDLTEIMKKGLIENQDQDRGEDATGIYAPRTGVLKDAMPADEWVDENIPDISHERFAIGHVRKASAKYGVDNRENPKNAQPYESKNWVLIHNGSIGVPRIKGYNYSSDTDSESIIAFAERQGIRTALRNIDAGSTVVLYDKKKRKLFFWTDGGRPLAIAYYKEMIIFASTKKIIRNALDVKDNFQIFPDISFATLYVNELLEFDLNNNRFYRREEIEYKPTVKKPAKKKKTDYSTVQTSLGLNVNKPLPKGSGSNPIDPSSKNVTSLSRPLNGIQHNYGSGQHYGSGKTVRISAQGGKAVYSVTASGKINVHKK